MCRNIKTLHHFVPPATEAEVEASALQFVRKLSGMRVPSKANEKVFNRAVEEIAHLTMHLLGDLVPNGPPHTREEEQAKAKARGRAREERMKREVLGQR